MFANCYKGRRVFITGHTGFKGSWLAAWLSQMGATVCGFADCVPTSPSHFEAMHLEQHVQDVRGDIRDRDAVIRAMNKGLPFYYLPDMDHGRKNSIFIPFFGVPAATVPMACRLAKLTRAKVCMCIAEMTDKGYVVHISPAWENYPTDDVEADTRRITAELENWILKLPDQYLWSHRRFKTRPEGEPSVYED